MTPFYILAGSFLVFLIAGSAGVAVLTPWTHALRGALSIMFLVTTFAHFGRNRADLIRMVPPVFPRPDLLITATGLLEIAGAMGLVLPATAKPAAACLALLLMAMFPANVFASRHTLSIAGKPVTPLPTRAALQGVFIGAVLVAGFA